MKIANAIYKLRTNANLSQEEFAVQFGVSQQSVQKWEAGESVPELDKIIKITKKFGVSLDAFILGNDNRIVEQMDGNIKINPQYKNMHDWDFYASNLLTEYRQSVEEGLDIDAYQEIFTTVAALPQTEIKQKFGDLLFEIVSNAPQREDYKYNEPSSLAEIKELRKPYKYQPNNTVALNDKIHGAWMGRICGCMLGKPIEGARTDELVPFLKDTDNYPMYRYILKSDLNETIMNKYSFNFQGMIFTDAYVGMPVDDDTNYMVLYQEIIEKYGRDFTPFDVSRAWLSSQSKNAYGTAEKVAFCNFVKGYEPPQSALYKNPYREWIGAQIRGDYFGYINPGNPEKAAEMAWRDASISHVKNGIYGEMFVAAMLAAAAETQNTEDIIQAGLAQIPCTSRLYESLQKVVTDYKNGVTQKECFSAIHKLYDEHDGHDWCHVISNAMIVTAALLYGKGDYTKSICMAVETGFDTDCNGATVGSVLGMTNGMKSIPQQWIEPMQDTLYTSIFRIDKVKISERAEMTMKHLLTETEV